MGKEKFSISDRISTKSVLAKQPINVTVPVSTAYDLKQINEVTAQVLGILGCPQCHSGFDLRFDYETRFVFDNQLNILNR